jgi:mono/diheme cytochrome c family protein
MPKPLKWFLAAGLAVLALFVGIVFVLQQRADDMRAGPVALHDVSFPVPFPLSPAEVDSLGLSPEEAEAMALDRALERGRHLVQARYGCADCHGEDFGGGTMAEAGPVGSFYGPNLTAGAGGRTAGFTPSDWDAIVRHGVLPDGARAIMPAVDFLRMSDRELSDIMAYVGSLPPVDRTMPPSTLGPVGKILVATGKMPFSADLVASLAPSHPLTPPAAAVTPEFGAHVAAPCAGCHGLDLAGGPVPGGPPDWPLAANLTPHADGLAGWSYDDFRRAVLEGRRPDGTELRVPMTIVLPLFRNMTETELEAMWLHLSSIPPLPGPPD